MFCCPSVLLHVTRLNRGDAIMNIGPLSECVTAFSEIAAVSVALFLPVYDKKQEKRKRTRNLKAIFRYLIKKSLDEENTSNLESYFKSVILSLTAMMISKYISWFSMRLKY